VYYSKLVKEIIAAAYSSSRLSAPYNGLVWSVLWIQRPAYAAAARVLPGQLSVQLVVRPLSVGSRFAESKRPSSVGRSVIGRRRT